MAYFDLRFAMLFILNILKSQGSNPWDWDPFDTINNNLTWIKFWIICILFLVFSFISIQVPLSPASPTRAAGYVRIQVTHFSPPLMVSFLALLLLPEMLFWYIYPTIMLLFSCTTCVSNVLKNIILSLRAILSAIPYFNVVIAATYTNEESEDDIERGIDEANLEEE